MPESIVQLTERFDLQISLLVIGAILILTLFVYNYLRTRKVKKQLQNQFSQTPLEGSTEFPSVMKEPVLEDTSSDRLEPSFREDSSIADDSLAVFNHQTEFKPESAFSESPQLYTSKMDPNIDCVVALKFALAISGNEVIERISTWPNNPNYRIALEGLFENGLTSIWEMVFPDHLYKEIQVSIQLANRRGPIRIDELSEFLGLAANLANELEAEIDLPPTPQVLAQAQDLDEFAVQCDVQLGLNLVPNMISWETKDIERAFQAYGFIMSRDGFSFNFSEGNQLIFKAQVPGLNFLTDDLQTFRVKSVVFSLEIPLVPESLNPFAKMFNVAQQIAKDIDGKILDDNGKVLEANSVGMIIAQLAPIYGLMHDRQISPGSPTATRLFS
jgi:hypothetical protein